MKPIQIAPTGGQSVYSDPALKGLGGYYEKSGYGTFPYSQYAILPGGGFELLDGVFGTDEVWFFHPNGLVDVEATESYTNGFNYPVVQSALINRMGWRQPTKSGYNDIVTGSNLISRSGRYFNDFHALCSAANLKDIQEDQAISPTDFNAYLTSLQKSVIMRCLNAVFSAPEYIEQNLTFERFGHQDYPIINAGNFVGFRISVGRTFDKAVQINSTTLLFDSDVSFNLYLFKDGKKTAIWNQSVTAVANESTIVDFTDLFLKYISADTKGSIFYFGYFQDDLGEARAIRENIIAWNKTLVYGIYPFMSKASAGDFDRNIIGFTDVNFGLNPEISSFKDWTQQIVKKASLFDEAIGLTMAYVVLEQLIYSIRQNGSERILKDGMSMASLIQDLNGTAPVTDGPPPVMGLKQRVEREMKRVKNAFVGCPKAVSDDLRGSGGYQLDGPAVSQMKFLEKIENGYNN